MAMADFYARLYQRQGVMRDDPFALLSDGPAADVLRRLHAEADRQMPALLLHYLPNLPRLLLGGAVRFDESQIRGFYADKYIL